MQYVSGEIATAAPEEWPELTAEGVDRIVAHTQTGDCAIANHSLYWLYREGDTWVMGSGSIRYDPNPVTEIVIAPDGTQTERRVAYCPDLMHRDVKLGHWWPGVDRP